MLPPAAFGPMLRRARAQAVISLARNAWIARVLRRDECKVVFTQIMHANLWGSAESLSGPAATLKATRTIRENLPRIAAEYDVRSVLDVPCGDFNWMRHVDWTVERYVGADIVDSVVRSNRIRFGRAEREFRSMNLVTDVPEAFDLVLIRDLFVHLPFDAIFRAIANVKRSGSRYVLMTSFPEARVNHDIPFGGFRPTNMEAAPFVLPPPLVTVADWDYLDVPAVRRKGRPAGEPWGRSLSLWRVSDLTPG